MSVMLCHKLQLPEYLTGIVNIRRCCIRWSVCLFLFPMRSGTTDVDLRLAYFHARVRMISLTFAVASVILIVCTLVVHQFVESRYLNP